MNYLAPDVVTLGNHEFDYGLPHLLARVKDYVRILLGVEKNN